VKQRSMIVKLYKSLKSGFFNYIQPRLHDKKKKEKKEKNASQEIRCLQRK